MSLIVNGVSIENLIVINSKTGEQIDVETLQEPLGNIIFQKQTAPEWFNYTAMDSAGVLEGQQAYNGTAVAFAIGKPIITITETTADDGTISQTESISYSEANGLREEYFTEKYGSSFVKSWDSTAAAPLQCVEDVLIIPDNYNGLPITKILDKAFAARTIASSVETRYQPYFYTNIVFGKNITTLGDMCFAGTGDKIELIDLPTTISSVAQKSFGDTKDYNSIIRFNSNTASQGMADYIPKIIYGRGVTQVVTPTSASGSVLVFEHQDGDSLSISYGMTMIKEAQTTTIYAEHDSALYYDWETMNITPTFYHLDGTLWGIASVTRSVSGTALDNLIWTISGDADYYTITKYNSFTKQDETYRYDGGFSVNPLELFSECSFCMNMFSYTPVIVVGYKAGCLKKTVEYTVGNWNYNGTDVDGETTSNAATYGFGINYDTTTDILTAKTNSILVNKIDHYRLRCNSNEYVNVSYQGNYNQDIKIKDYADYFGLEVGTEYTFSYMAKLKGLCYVYADAAYTNSIEATYGGN